MSVALDRRGRIFVADDLNHRVAVFGSDGRFLKAIGRKGRGPGEFQTPWLVATDPRDSVFVWDMELSRIAVFDPELNYRRDFRVPPHWLVTGMEFLPDGRLLVAAYGRGEPGALHVLERDGVLHRTFGPRLGGDDLGGFEASLLGGHIDLAGQTIVYSNKSPYEIRFYDLGGQLRRRCTGRQSWTTPPAAAVVRSERADALQWNRYVHSAAVLALGGGLYLNVVADPVEDRRLLDLLTSDCRLLRRTVIDHPLTLAGHSGSRVVGVRNLEYPEVVVYELRVLNR